MPLALETYIWAFAALARASFGSVFQCQATSAALPCSFS